MTTQSAVLCSFTLTTASREPGRYGEPEPLRDHAVEPGRLEAVEPGGRGRELGRRRRDPEALAAVEQLRAPLLERPLVHRLAVPEQQVEGDEDRRDLGGEPADAALGRVQPHLHRVEVEHAVARDHDLAVERGVGREQLAERPQLGEVAQQRPLVARPERELAAVVLEHAAEAVPLRLVLPALAGGQLADELGLHRREGDVRAGHRPRLARGQPSGQWSQGPSSFSISRQPRGRSSRARSVCPSTTTSVGSPVDAEAADEIGPGVLVDDEHAEGAVVAAPLQHLGEEPFHPATLAGQRRREEDQAAASRPAPD